MDFPYNIIINNSKTEQPQRLTYKVTAQNAVKPVTLAEAKLHLKMDDIDADDTLIEGLIAAATEHAQNYTNRIFLSSEIKQVYNRFPVSGEVLRLAVTPVISVASVVYKDEDGNNQTWSTDDYVLDLYSEPCEISEAKGISFPTTIEERNAVTITYTSGYGTTADDVPKSIKQAIYLLLSHFYNYRSDTVSEKRTAAERLLGMYRVHRN